MPPKIPDTPFAYVIGHGHNTQLLAALFGVAPNPFYLPDSVHRFADLPTMRFAMNMYQPYTNREWSGMDNLARAYARPKNGIFRHISHIVVTFSPVPPDCQPGEETLLEELSEWVHFAEDYSPQLKTCFLQRTAIVVTGEPPTDEMFARVQQRGRELGLRDGAVMAVSTARWRGPSNDSTASPASRALSESALLDSLAADRSSFFSVLPVRFVWPRPRRTRHSVATHSPLTHQPGSATLFDSLPSNFQMQWSKSNAAA